jgi:hypothetical protein
MWEPRCLTTLWASTACYRDSSFGLLFITDVANFLRGVRLYWVIYIHHAFASRCRKLRRWYRKLCQHCLFHVRTNSFSCSACDWTLYNLAWMHLAQKPVTDSCGHRSETSDFIKVWEQKFLFMRKLIAGWIRVMVTCHLVQNILSSRLMSNSIKIEYTKL